MFGENPVSIVCPSCQQQVLTHVEYETSTLTHITAGIFCILGWEFIEKLLIFDFFN